MNDKVSPASVKKTVDTPDKIKERHHNQMVKVRREGYEEGLKEGRLEMLNWLQNKYLGDDAPDRDTPEGKAVIALAGEVAKQFLAKKK